MFRFHSRVNHHSVFAHNLRRIWHITVLATSVFHISRHYTLKTIAFNVGTSSENIRFFIHYILCLSVFACCQLHGVCHSPLPTPFRLRRSFTYCRIIPINLLTFYWSLFNFIGMNHAIVRWWCIDTFIERGIRDAGGGGVGEEVVVACCCACQRHISLLLLGQWHQSSGWNWRNSDDQTLVDFKSLCCELKERRQLPIWIPSKPVLVFGLCSL